MTPHKYKPDPDTLRAILAYITDGSVILHPFRGGKWQRIRI